MGPYRIPNGWEQQALRMIQRMLRSFNSVSSATLLWDPANQRYAVGVEYDHNISRRIPESYFGVMVYQYPEIPSAITQKGTPGATISYGPTRLGLDQGFGIGWPMVQVQGGGVGYTPGNYCQPYMDMGGNPTGYFPSAYSFGCGCGG